MSQRIGQAPGGLRQLRILLRIWWLQMRRRPMRVGEAPRLSGAPTFLLISLLTSFYIAMITWQNVAHNVKLDPGLFTVHALAILVVGFASALSKGAGRVQLRGTRNDAFLDHLPIRPLAQLGLQFTDMFTLLPLTACGVLASISVKRSLGVADLVPALLATFGFASSYVTGSAVAAWIRAVGSQALARWSGYVGLALTILGTAGALLPLSSVWTVHQNSPWARAAELWIGPSPQLLPLFVAFLAIGGLGYRALEAAHHYGFDRLDPQMRAPKRSKGFRGRIALERVMMMRQGGRALLIVFIMLAGIVVFLVTTPSFSRLPTATFGFATGFAIYLGALQTIGQAGRAARGDQAARPFLATLPMSPHEILDGKARALRLLLLPVLAFLIVLAIASFVRPDSDYTYRIVLSILSLYVLADGAVNIAFLSTGIGVLGAGGAQTTTGFSTQILMLPMFATVLAPNDWSATMACVAMLAVAWESRRAARLNVRWLDDPADDVDRETTVWRALLAASAFFALQALTYRILSVFEVAPGYALAIAFGCSALLLALLTWRNDERFESPRFLPKQPAYLVLGALAGATSGLLAREFARWLPAQVDTSNDFSTGEVVAMGISMTIVAPLVEEYFFRGWLQRAIEADLPAQRKAWAFVIGACAFALAHFGSYGVPQLVLGLLAGWLFFRSRALWPSVLAHALHNGVVLLLGVDR
jgi:membrane protease YdiL (CAAX protease family)